MSLSEMRSVSVCIFGIIHYFLSKTSQALLRMLKVEEVTWEEVTVTGDAKQQVT